MVTNKMAALQSLLQMLEISENKGDKKTWLKAANEVNQDKRVWSSSKIMSSIARKQYAAMGCPEDIAQANARILQVNIDRYNSEIKNS